LLKQVTEVQGLKPKNIRLDFTIEMKEDMRKVIAAFLDRYLYNKKTELELQNFTTVHFKRGVE